jgi:hypothetical protein
MLRDPAGHLFIVDQRTLGAVPRAQQAKGDPGGIHRGEREVDR